MNAALASTAVTVSGGELGGIGTHRRHGQLSSGGRLAPGNSIGVLTEGATSFAWGATFEYEVDSTDLNNLGTAADLLVVNGNLDDRLGLAARVQRPGAQPRPSWKTRPCSR